MDEFDASLGKAGPELRPDRGRRSAPSLPFETKKPEFGLCADVPPGIFSGKICVSVDRGCSNFTFVQ